jgi:3-deoxy-7-phosphoheptulonate synthase
MVLPSFFPPHPGPGISGGSLRTIPIADGVQFGGDAFVVMAGPCAVESAEQLSEAATAVAAAGAGMLRGGAYKPRTSPRSFQGLGRQGLELLAHASADTGLPVVTEVLDPRDLEVVSEHASMLQIGSRNMQNFALLREVGRCRKPVLLKRGAAATIDELLAAVEYIVQGGNERIVLCERGVRGFDPSTRYLLDLAAVPVLKQRCDLPVVVDPSHGTGRRELIAPLSRAAAAVGADGLLVEVHPDPASALCDGAQALLPADFASLMVDLRRMLPMLGRRLGRPAASDGGAAFSDSLSDGVIAP